MLDTNELLQAEVHALGVLVRALIAHLPDPAAYERTVARDLDVQLTRLLAAGEFPFAKHLETLVLSQSQAR